ncbi:unnamed protein product [Microthlaspi erraticum]|uniref:RNase H type-1 domain-containing protein n=1 Tax=Microthlaspi erraticum TaxID=1685480 RepID=A0A6D2HE76_9BRAS|nr:unnamed protein product [Microthlaspi erraticum]
MANAREWERAHATATNQEKKGKRVANHQAGHQPTVVFVDAAWRSDTQVAGFGWSFTDGHQLTLEEGSGAEAPVVSALAAEAIAIREALIQAKMKNWNSLCLKSDSQTLVRAIRSNDKIAEILGVLCDIKTLASTFVSISFVFTPRSENSRADAIAKSALALFVTTEV